MPGLEDVGSLPELASQPLDHRAGLFTLRRVALQVVEGPAELDRLTGGVDPNPRPKARRHVND